MIVGDPSGQGFVEGFFDVAFFGDGGGLLVEGANG